jgi:ribosomal protein S27E
MYRQTNQQSLTTDATCPECNSKSVLYQGGTITCSNCGHVIASPKNKKNKYNAIRTVAKDGLKRDSKFEANVADELYLRKQAGDIVDYESQFQVEMWIYREDGLKAFPVKHKIDFRIEHVDGSFELYEAKGVETSDYKWRRKLLEELWLPFHKDHIYTVRKQGFRNKKK